jgi:hypothetical protein
VGLSDLRRWLEIHDMYVNSSIMDEGPLVKNVPYNIKERFIQIQLC